MSTNWTDGPNLPDSISTNILGMSDNFILLRSAFASASAPASPVKGQIWYEDLGSNLYAKHIYNGIAWIEELAGDGVDGDLAVWNGPTSLSVTDFSAADLDDAVDKAHTQNTDTGTPANFDVPGKVLTPEVKTDTDTPTDLTITTGALKTLLLATGVYKDANVGSLVLQTGGTLPGIVEWLDNIGGSSGIYTRGFDVNEQGSGSIEIPHDYKEGTDLIFHVHWGVNDAPSTTDYVKWQLTYSVTRAGITFPPSTAIVIETATDTQYKLILSSFAAITGTNFKVEDQFNFEIKRIAAVGDVFAGEALVGTIGFHYQTDTLGSRNISTK